MHKVLDQLNNDQSFLAVGLTRATKVYQAKFDSGSTSEETLKELNWEVVEFIFIYKDVFYKVCYLTHLKVCYFTLKACI